MSHTSVLRFGLILAAALVLLAGLATFAIYQSRPQAQPAQEEFGKPVMAAQIEFLAEAMQRSAARIAAHPQTLACFAGAAPEVCQAQAANLYALNQDATVLFVTDGQRQLLPGFLPGDARRLLASNAGRGGTGATATATFNLSLSHPVVDSDGKRLGVVIVEQSVPQLQALFDHPAAAGCRRLRRTAAKPAGRCVGGADAARQSGDQAPRPAYPDRAGGNAVADRRVAPGHAGG